MRRDTYEKLMKESFTGIKKIFDELDITFWLMCGTCLGAVRDKNFIEWDQDIDIGAKDISQRKFNELVGVLKQKREIVNFPIHFNPPCTRRIKTMKMLDIFFYPEAPKLEEIVFLGNTYFIPSPVEFYLAKRYGEDWKIPRKDWRFKEAATEWKKAERVSIIIPRWNCGKNIIRCIKLIKEKTTYPNYRIIVIDDHSDENDEGWQWLREHEGEIELYRNTENHGITYNLNRGVKLAGGDDVVKMDSDNQILTKGWLQTFVYFVERNPKTLPSAIFTNSDGVNIRWPPENFFWNIQGHIERTHALKFGVPVDTFREVTKSTRIQGACCYLTRELINKIFPMEEHYVYASFDREMSLRAWQANYEVVTLRKIKCWHEGLGNNRKKRIEEKELEKGRKFFEDKWKGNPIWNYLEKAINSKFIQA